VSEDTVRPWGEWLQKRREDLGISLEQAEADTHIRLRYLQALESGDLSSLPDPFVGRGFLRNYAAYLELDLSEGAERFPEIFALPASKPIEVNETSPFVTEPFRPVALHRIGGENRRRWLLIGVVVIVVAALALLAWWAYPRVFAYLPWGSVAVPSTSEPTDQASEAVLSTATSTPTATRTTTATAAATNVSTTTATLEATLTPSVTLSPSPSPSPSPPIYTGIFLELLFTDTSWIQVTVDGVRQFQGELAEDTYRSWYGEERIELRIGNAGVVQVTINGQALGTLGEPGEVIDRVFEKGGEEVTEATITPVATGEQAPQPSDTPTAPATLTPTIETTGVSTAIPTISATATVTSTISATATVTPTISATPTLTPTATITATVSP
jgi:cytoskeletal protein RodZ